MNTQMTEQRPTRVRKTLAERQEELEAQLEALKAQAQEEDFLSSPAYKSLRAGFLSLKKTHMALMEDSAIQDEETAEMVVEHVSEAIGNLKAIWDKLLLRPVIVRSPV